MVRILVADENPLYRTGLRAVIDAALADTEFIEASDLDSMMRVLMESEPIDLALVSQSLTGSDDPHIIRDFKRASATPRYVIISTECPFDQVLRYIAEGFHGFISKLQRDDEIAESVQEIMAGRLSVPRELMPTASAPPAGNERPRDATAQRRWTRRQDAFGLTPRQRDVLALLADGLSNREIAQALHIAEPTTKIHVSALMRALNVRNRTEAAILARNLLGTIASDLADEKTPQNKKARQ